MPRVLITVLALAAAWVAVTVMADDMPDHVDRNARHPGFTGACRYQEALNLGGTIYLANPGAHQPRFLRDAVAGDPYATVAARTPDADACEGELDDDASTYLEPGATLHPVDVWSPTFRLVSVQPSGRMVLYQAAWSTTARWAGDYLDLAVRGATVALTPVNRCPDNAVCDLNTSPHLPTDRADDLIGSILVSRIDPTAIDHSSSADADTLQIWVDFPEETNLNLSFGCDDRTSTTGIVLPDGAFSEQEFEQLCLVDDASGGVSRGDIW